MVGTALALTPLWNGWGSGVPMCNLPPSCQGPRMARSALSSARRRPWLSMPPAASNGCHMLSHSPMAYEASVAVLPSAWPCWLPLPTPPGLSLFLPFTIQYGRSSLQEALGLGLQPLLG